MALLPGRTARPPWPHLCGQGTTELQSADRACRQPRRGARIRRLLAAGRSTGAGILARPAHSVLHAQVRSGPRCRRHDCRARHDCAAHAGASGHAPSAGGDRPAARRAFGQSQRLYQPDFGRACARIARWPDPCGARWRRMRARPRIDDRSRARRRNGRNPAPRAPSNWTRARARAGVSRHPASSPAITRRASRSA